MRILALRGENLASLDGRFEIDLMAPPLGGSGLFAITGPTGAGKSTLLDALCLALFNDTPRLQGASPGITTGRAEDPEQLGIGDVRGILRRGAAEGMAGVDFLGIDGRRYRATWTVRRARRQATGALQKVSMSLVSLPDETPVGTTLTDTLAAIRDRLGLDFHQFRRTVLLAQGEFAGFLKAKGNERGEILARLTGTEIYAGISKLAFQRAKEERLALESLKATLAGLDIPGPAAEAALLAGEAEGIARAKALEATSKELEREIAWHQELTARDDAVARQQQAVAQADAALAALRDATDTLALYDRCQPLAAPLAGLERAEQAVATARERLGAAQSALTKAVEMETAERAGLATAEAACQEARQKREEMRPVLERARALLDRIGEATEDCARRQAEAVTAAAAAGEAADQLAALDATLSRQRDELGRVEGWLSANRPLDGVARDWPRWAELLDRLATCRREFTDGAAALRRAEADLAAASAPLPGLEAGAAAAADRLSAAEAAVAGLRSDDDLPALTAARESAGARAEAARTLLEAAQTLAQVRGDLAAVAQARLAAAERAAARTARLAVLSERLPRAEGELQGVAGSVEMWLAATGRSAEDLRDTLLPGQPCPVCGSREHPFAAADHPDLADALANLRQRQQELAAEVRSLQAERATLAAQAAADADAEPALADREAKARARQVEAERRLADAAPACPPDLPPLAGSDADLPALQAGVTAIQRQAAAAADAERAALARAQAYREALETRDRAAQARTDADSALAAARDSHRTARTTLEGRQAERQRLQAEAAEVQDRLHPAFAHVADWRTAAWTDPDSFRTLWDQRAQAWTRNTDQAATLRQALGTGDVRREALAAAVERTGQARLQADTALMQAEARLQQLGRDLESLLGGRHPDELDAALSAAIDTAEATLTLARTRHGAAREALAHAGSAAQGAQSNVAEAERIRFDSAEAFSRLLAALETSRADVARVLALGHDWAKATRQRIAAANQTVSEQKSILAERVRLRNDHAALLLSPRTLAEALTDQAATLTALEEARTGIQAARATLTRIATLKEQRDGLQARILAQEAQVELWGALDDLIGSAKGNRFQNVAQSVSLDLLLQAANRHLSDLAPRYRLERALGNGEAGALEIQIVDRDMADEVRSVHSLSGGESFLVSLALALGLSALVGSSATIGTLFIDEGFGTLDPTSLDVALGCLETLQAQGRQIGVISHVAALNERIGIQVQVLRQGGGRSVIRIGDGTATLAA